MYLDSVTINSNGKQWRAVGTYKKVIRFWYTDDPNNCEDCGKKGVNTLQKVEIDEESGVRLYHREFLFKNAQLVFCFLNNEKAYRYYFNETKLIKYIEDKYTFPDSKLAEINIKPVNLEANELKALFQSLHY